MANANGILTSPTLLRELANPDNSETAWRTFLERYQPLIHGWCCRWGLNYSQAEEVTAGALAKLVEAMRTFVYDPGRGFRGWLKTVVNNAVRSTWRQAARHADYLRSGDPVVHRLLEQVESPGDVDGLVQELDQALEHEQQQLVEQVLARAQKRVQAHTWLAYWLTVMEQVPAADVAQRLEMTVGAVYMAKKRVRDVLEEEGARVRKQDEGWRAGDP